MEASVRPPEKVVPEPQGRTTVSPAVFRVKEEAVLAAEGRPARGEYGWYRGAWLRPVANVFSLRFFYFPKEEWR